MRVWFRCARQKAFRSIPYFLFQLYVKISLFFEHCFHDIFCCSKTKLMNFLHKPVALRATRAVQYPAWGGSPEGGPAKGQAFRVFFFSRPNCGHCFLLVVETSWGLETVDHPKIMFGLLWPVSQCDHREPKDALWGRGSGGTGLETPPRFNEKTSGEGTTVEISGGRGKTARHFGRSTVGAVLREGDGGPCGGGPPWWRSRAVQGLGQGGLV